MGELYVEYHARGERDEITTTTRLIPKHENFNVTINEAHQNLLVKFIKLRHKYSLCKSVLAVIFILIVIAICIFTVIKLIQNNPITSNLIQTNHYNSTVQSTIEITKDNVTEKYDLIQTNHYNSTVQSTTKDNVTEKYDTTSMTESTDTTDTNAIYLVPKTSTIPEEEEKHDEIEPIDGIKGHNDILHSSPNDSCPKNGCPITKNEYGKCYEIAKKEYTDEVMKFNQNTCEPPLKYTLSVQEFSNNESHGMIVSTNASTILTLSTHLHGYTIMSPEFVKMTTCDGTCCCQDNKRCQEIESNYTMVIIHLKDFYKKSLYIYVEYRNITRCNCRK